MNNSKIIAASLILLAGWLLIVEASSHMPRPYAPAPSHGCRGYECRPRHVEQSYRGGSHGPYHSYAVRPAVYGGPRLYTYKGYARHPLPPVKVHMKAAAFNPVTGKHYAAPLTVAIETAPHYPSRPQPYPAPVTRYPARAPAAKCQGYNCHQATSAAPAYTLRPIKTILLAQVAPIEQAYSNHAAAAAAVAPAAYSERPHPTGYGSGGRQYQHKKSSKPRRKSYRKSGGSKKRAPVNGGGY